MHIRLYSEVITAKLMSTPGGSRRYPCGVWGGHPEDLLAGTCKHAAQCC